MEKGVSKIKRGFTVIEVSLVIAIGGLIFLMVFVALPGLRASQRDAQRRDDMLAFVETIKKYQTNNRGALPTGVGIVEYNKEESGSNSWQAFYNNYLNSFIDPDGNYYKLDVRNCEGATELGEECDDGGIDDKSLSETEYTILVIKKAKCSGSKATLVSNPRNLAVLYRLEGSGVYCTST